jgi:hypothetical protein
MCSHSTRQIHWSSAPLILSISFECGLSCPSKCAAHILRVRVILSIEVHCSYYSSAGFGPLNYSLRASSASILFECGLRSLESSSSGQQRLQIIRVWDLVPRIVFFGPAAPLYYSRAGFGPSNCSLRASSASILFESGLWSLELFPSDLRHLCIIRVRASVPRIIFIGLATPSHYSRAGFSPLNYFLRASSASTLFECGFPIPQIASCGHQCFYSIRIRTAVLQISISG